VVDFIKQKKFEISFLLTWIIHESRLL